MPAMPSWLEPPQLVGIAIVAAVLGLYGAIALARKHRFKALATSLGAVHVDTGIFAPGRIEGRDFEIEARTVGMGRYKKYRTSIQVTSAGAPGRYLVKPEFFEHFPDWKHALALGVHEERAFVVTVSWPRYREADASERQLLLDWLGRSRTFDPHRVGRQLQVLRIRDITIEKGSLAVSFPGAVSRVDRLRDTLAVLQSVGA